MKLDLSNIVEFLDGPSRNEWVYVGVYSVHLRKSHRLIEGRLERCVDLSNVQRSGEVYGGFWELFAGLCRLGAERGFCYLYLENTHNRALKKAYIQRGCILIREPYILGCRRGNASEEDCEMFDVNLYKKLRPTQVDIDKMNGLIFNI